MKKLITNIIYKLQRYFKIDFFYLIKGEAWLILGKAINTIVVFTTAWAWANWIDKGIYGNYQYILSLVGIVSIFSLPEMEAAVIQAVARNFEGSFIKGFKTKLKWGLLGSLLTLIIAGYYFFQGNLNLSLALLVVALFLFLFNASLAYTGFLTGKRLFSVQVKYDSITQITAGAIMLLTLFLIKKIFFNWPGHIILFLIISVYFISRTSLRFFFFMKTKTRFLPNTKEDPETVSYGKKLSFSGIIDVLSSSLDKILLFHYLGAVELAVYAFAVLVPQQINVFLKHIGALALPKFSIRSKDEIRETLLRKIFYLATLISFLVIVYILTASFIYQIFFPKYLDSVAYSRIFALSIIPLSFSMGAIFRAKMMIKQIYQIKIIVPLVRASLFLILIPLYGIWGAVIGVLITRTFSAFLAVFLFKKYF